jgi:sugar phosphate isomerase/epimerase
MSVISFMLANYVARPLGYDMHGWGEGAQATMAHFEPEATFGPRFEEYLVDVKSLGFDAIDMWTDILGPRSATPSKIETALSLLRKYNLQVCSYGGWFGGTPEEFASVCGLAAAFDSRLLAGSTSVLVKDRHFVVATLREHGLRLGIENHPETPSEMLEKIGDGAGGVLGTTVDTGWYGTQGVDAAEAIRQLAPHVLAVHLKDVRQVGAHNTCRFGDGVVPIERCVRVLQEQRYAGPITVEHEPEQYDPSPEIADSLRMLRGWLGA